MIFLHLLAIIAWLFQLLICGPGCKGILGLVCVWVWVCVFVWLMSQLPFPLNCLPISLHPKLCTAELSYGSCVPIFGCCLTYIYLLLYLLLHEQVEFFVLKVKQSKKKKNLENHERRDLVLWYWKFRFF